MDNIDSLKKDLNELSDPERKKNLQRYFKTGEGEYGEGDIFLGLRVPDIRKVARKYRKLELPKVLELLHSDIHEHRSAALMILVYQYQKGTNEQKRKIVELYLENTDHINNWDLVDGSSHKILGDYYRDKPKDKLYELAKSKSLWERRISIISTFKFIKDDSFKTSLKIAEMLLQDEHDLIHKAVGWVLREICKKDQAVLENFLDKYHQVMPRTMLRYSIEKLEKQKRQYYLKKK